MKKSVQKLTTEVLLAKVRCAIEKGDYWDTSHAALRKSQRKILRSEMEYVLETGWHEKKKDTLDEFYQAWNYAIRGKTIDERELRIIISFENKMLIITAIDLTK